MEDLVDLIDTKASIEGFYANNRYITTSTTAPIPITATNLTWDNVVAGISEDDLLAALKKLQKKMTPKTISLNCPNCGAPTSIALNDHILKCKYCRSAYFVGTELTRCVE